MSDIKVLTEQELKANWNQPNNELAPFISALKNSGVANADTFNKQELIQAIYFCQRHKMNPLDGDIYFVPYKGRLTKITSIHWLTQKAQETGLLLGLSSDFDETRQTATAELVLWNEKAQREAKFSVSVHLSEYSTNQNLWLSKPSTMLQKVARVQVIRNSGILGALKGIYTREEMDQAFIVKEESKPLNSKMYDLNKLKENEVSEPEIIEEEKFGGYGEF